MNATHAADPAILTVVITAIEFAGVAVIVVAALVATVIYIRDGFSDRARWAPGFQSFRATLGRGILSPCPAWSQLGAPSCPLLLSFAPPACSP